jgi:hypothetical protein
MQTRLRSLSLMSLVLLAGCSENDLGVGAIDAAPNSGGAPGGSGGSGSGGLSTIGTGGTSGPWSGGAGGADTGAGGAGGADAGACGEATCLAALFQTCVPEGECAMRLGSTVFYDICYGNGVTVSRTLRDYGATTTVERDGAPCYSIETWSPANASAISYVITDGNGNPIATAVTADKAGHVTVTCTGGSPITVDGSCLRPVSDSPTCDLQTCPTSGTDGLDGGGLDGGGLDGGGLDGGGLDGGGLDGGMGADVSGSGGVCDPFVAIPKPIALAAILGVGRSADGTVYLADQSDGTSRVFVSDASGALVRRRVAGSGSASDASMTEYVFTVTDVPSPFVLEIDVPKSGAVRMGVLPATLTDNKSFVIGQEGEELTVLPSSAVAGMPVRNLPGDVTVEYVATLPDGELMLVTRPTDDWTYSDFRLFLGPTTAVLERVVTSVTRTRDGGTTYIVFDLDGAQATAYFPVVRADAGPNPPSATLTVAGVETPLTRQATVPAVTYLCL